MKKYFLNPVDVFVCVLLMFLTGGMFIALLISLVISTSTQPIDFGIAIAFLSIPLLLMIPQVCYIKKYYGYIFLDDNHLILQKEKSK